MDSFDLNALNGLKRQSNSANQAEQKQALRQAAEQFEAIFVQKALESADKATRTLGPESSSNMDFYRSLSNSQLSQSIAKEGSIGLADHMVQQIESSQKHRVSTQEALERLEQRQALRESPHVSMHLPAKSPNVQSKNNDPVGDQTDAWSQEYVRKILTNE